MSSTFFGINIAQSGLAAQKRAMDIVGYNISNANDPTYKRQRVVSVQGQVLATSQDASSLTTTAFGSGVNSGDVERIYDTLIENRLRSAYQASGEWEFKADTLSQLETTLGEPSDTGLANDLDTFWASWQTVSTTPDSTSLKSALLEDTSALCQRIQYTYGQMSDMLEDLNLSTIDQVENINLYAEEIGKLNNEIGALSSGAIPVNDLLNRRDALVQELSKLVSVSQYGNGKDDFILSIGGTVLVQGTKVNTLTTAQDASGQQQILWESDSSPVNITSGKLKATLDLKDDLIPSYMQQLDDMATQLVETVNAAHHNGVTTGSTSQAGGDFFKAGTTAANICLDDSIVGHPDLVAASSTTDPGSSNGDNALAISLLKDSTTSSGYTINEMYQNLIGDLGGTSAAAQTQSEAHSLSVDQLTTEEQSVSGVSLDEEMTNMIKFQQAYNAAAKVLSTMDEMLDILMNA